MTKQQSTILIAGVMTLILAAAIVVSMSLQKRDFDKIVNQSLRTSEGYDQQFVNLVNKLETELAIRARFGYSGGKDPMTGRRREVALPRPVAESRPVQVAAVVEQKPDPVRLTAIILDDRSGRFTAIVMHGERSLSVEVGDRILDRTIINISNQAVVMEDSRNVYRYTLMGEQTSRPR